MDKPLLRWGILGCANIARKNWKAIWHSGNGRVSAVASRDLQRARRFVEECQAQAPFQPAPRAVGSYEELLAAEDVDAVYVPLPTGIRGPWVKRAAEAAKHVVSEKPCATSVTELVEILETCRRQRVQFMDGVMFMHSGRLQRIREVLDDGQTVGAIRRITSAFSFRGSEDFFVSNIRTRHDLEPYGCLGDLGWYCIRFTLWAMNWKLPQRVTGQLLSHAPQPSAHPPVPTEASGELFFEGGVSGGFYCSFLTESEQWVNVGGTAGSLRVPDFVLPFAGSELAFETDNPGRDRDLGLHPNTRRWVVKERSHNDPTAQESRMFHNFAEHIRSGKLNPLWPEMALKTQQVLQACHASALDEGRPVRLDLAPNA
ncbi:MAG TPA: Gfo/Idh/MocA family oxidoreductase [Candidatus Acidoferrum sp.]|nr:Gfo/Idh/MocA family oxidoreductase [Candidatus Acidoferrum sp.]